MRLRAGALSALLRAARPVCNALTVANADVPPVATDHFARHGEVLRFELGKDSSTEQANDPACQDHIWRAIFASEPGVVVLATGDGAGHGAGHGEGRGFLVPLDAARRLGWAVEILAWTASVNRRFPAWAAEAGTRFIPLDPYYGVITYIEGGRTVVPLRLRHRPTAEPSPTAVHLPPSLLR